MSENVFFTKIAASRTYILASSTINCAENVVMHFQTRV